MCSLPISCTELSSVYNSKLPPSSSWITVSCPLPRVSAICILTSHQPRYSVSLSTLTHPNHTHDFSPNLSCSAKYCSILPSSVSLSSIKVPHTRTFLSLHLPNEFRILSLLITPTNIMTPSCCVDSRAGWVLSSGFPSCITHTKFFPWLPDPLCSGLCPSPILTFHSALYSGGQGGLCAVPSGSWCHLHRECFFPMHLHSLLNFLDRISDLIIAIKYLFTSYPSSCFISSILFVLIWHILIYILSHSWPEFKFHKGKHIVYQNSC